MYYNIGWQRCPFCDKVFTDIQNEDMADHIIACAREKVGITQASAGDDPDREDPEAQSDHHSHK